jgi:hypothetical protein
MRQLKIFNSYLFLLCIYGILWVVVFRLLNYYFDLVIQVGIYTSIVASLVILLLRKTEGKLKKQRNLFLKNICIDNLGLAILTCATGLVFLFSIVAINDRSLSVYLTATVAKNPSGSKLDQLDNFIQTDWNRNNREMTKRIREQIILGNFRFTKDGNYVCPTKQLEIYTRVNVLITKIIGTDLVYVNGSNGLKQNTSNEKDTCA